MQCQNKASLLCPPAQQRHLSVWPLHQGKERNAYAHSALFFLVGCGLSDVLIARSLLLLLLALRGELLDYCLLQFVGVDAVAPRCAQQHIVCALAGLIRQTEQCHFQLQSTERGLVALGNLLG